jgi:hypothetical protein
LFGEVKQKDIAKHPAFLGLALLSVVEADLLEADKVIGRESRHSVSVHVDGDASWLQVSLSHPPPPHSLEPKDGTAQDGED